MNYIDSLGQTGSVCFNAQGLLKYIDNHYQAKFLSSIIHIASLLKGRGINVTWVFVDTELAPTSSNSIVDVSQTFNISKLTNLPFVSNLPELINELQRYFVHNNWSIVTLEEHLRGSNYLIAKY